MQYVYTSGFLYKCHVSHNGANGLESKSICLFRPVQSSSPGGGIGAKCTVSNCILCVLANKTPLYIDLKAILIDEKINIQASAQSTVFDCRPKSNTSFDRKPKSDSSFGHSCPTSPPSQATVLKRRTLWTPFCQSQPLLCSFSSDYLQFQFTLTQDISHFWKQNSSVFKDYKRGPAGTENIMSC